MRGGEEKDGNTHLARGSREAEAERAEEEHSGTGVVAMRCKRRMKEAR
jgi:hypothetical protein